MSYATIANVKSLFRDFADNADAAVNDVELQDFLDDAEVTINSKIGTLYTLPITVPANPESYKVLAMIEKYIAAGVVDDILNSYSEADKKPMWTEKAMKMLKALVPPKNKSDCNQCEPTMKLPDAIYNGTSVQRGKIKLSATSGRQFTKGENANNW